MANIEVMNKVNYQKEMEKVLEQAVSLTAEGHAAPTLFLHSCCAPCSSYVLDCLRAYFRITVFYYNPNISEDKEYEKRVEEQKRLIGILNGRTAEGEKGYPIAVVEGEHDVQAFFERTAGLADCPEGGKRCFLCYELRLEETARRAREGGFDYFATTLTVSPLKNAEKLNEIGQRLSGVYGVKWLPSDFKKKDGYKQSVELSAKYGLYRQDYCGCVYSKAERERR